MKKIILTGIAVIVLGSTIYAQDIPKLWTLEECISYATANNINLKQKEQEEELGKVELKTSQNSWMPNLNASLGQNMDFGRTPSRDGTIIDQNSINSSFNMQLNMPLFYGFKIANDIAFRKLNLMAVTESLNKAKDELALNITSYYLQALYSKELLNIAELQVSITKEQLIRTEALINAGKIPVAQLSYIKAQLANDEATLVEAKSSVSLALLDLAQALELERMGVDFDIVQPETGYVVPDDNISGILPHDIDDIYNNAVTFKPQIKEQKFLLESQRKLLRIAQADYYPRLNFNANYGNGYYRYGGNDIESVSFGSQLKQNERKTIGVNLNIPIFNRFAVKNNVSQVRIGIINQELAVENSKKTLYKEIQQAYFMTVTAQAKYLASEKSIIASKEALYYEEESYMAGKSSVFEYNESKAKYVQSMSEQAQAKYNFIFRTKILDFYNGISITL
ncbi:MAG: TolC family protein [Bacteroidales bacterium]|jgi:outer membrane protein|nr:TolC family protein [Bacteroidales bacterium]